MLPFQHQCGGAFADRHVTARRPIFDLSQGGAHITSQVDRTDHCGFDFTPLQGAHTSFQRAQAGGLFT